MALRMPRNEAERIELLEWAAKRIPNVTRFGDTAYPLAVERNSQVVAVAVYHEWRGRSVELSMAADTPRWATRDAIAGILSWPFQVLRALRITTITPSKNTRALKLNEGLGFIQEGLMRDAFKDDDAVIMGLTHRDWLAGRFVAVEMLRAA